MAAAAEGLFALELLVEEVVLAAAPGPTLRPAVALRLLGFPTLMLHPVAAAPPLRPGRAFPFGRGKRCLFRWRRSSLYTALCRQPLRALLLAFPVELAPSTPRLLGSCDVSLAPAASELLQQPEVPASCSRRGRFPLRDAAGHPVGELVLGYRLTSLQAGEEPPPPSTASPCAATPPASSPEPRAEEKEESEELEGNIFCPPMLYYSREAAESHLSPANATTGQWKYIKAGRLEDKDKGQSPPRPSAGPSLLHPTSPQHLHHTLGQLPLLSALLGELSVLTRCITPVVAHPKHAWLYQVPGSGGMASQPPGPGHSSALKPSEVPMKVHGSSEDAKSEFKQEQDTTTPESFQPKKGPKKGLLQGKTGAERNCKTKENRPPRRKLLYGLTNTLRLRLQQTNPGKLEIHERREQYRKKQIEVLKERSTLSKRKLLRTAGEQHAVSYRHCGKTDSSKNDNQFHKAIETLQNDALADNISVTGDVSLDLQKWVTASLLKDNEIADWGGPASLKEKTVLKPDEKEKSAKTQLTHAKGSNEEVIHLIHRKTMEHGGVSVASGCKPSPSSSIENSSEFIYSDDFVASPENTVYSEDFTSAEHVGRNLEACDSSPEPLRLESQKQGTELESNKSRISKMSQRAESASEPLSISSASSPGQSQKRNHDLKISLRNSGESVDSFSLAQLELSLLDEEQKAQKISEDENEGDGHIKQVATQRSKQVSLESDLNIGKGQTSAEKGQSVTEVSSYLPSNMPDPELSILEDSMSDIEDNFLGKLCVPNQYKDISELVVSKLPGYTM
ncbi:microtubule-associated protein 10 [Pogoniulus pusillus]|uniref:microtubule-associated protein 10 n=1 Tax=Pogoniulus pusillus TaxID=488313 RepID=UPI0030B94ADD